MPDPNTQLLNLAVKASRLAQSMAADRKAEGKMFEQARNAANDAVVRGVLRDPRSPPQKREEPR